MLTKKEAIFLALIFITYVIVSQLNKARIQRQIDQNLRTTTGLVYDIDTMISRTGGEDIYVYFRYNANNQRYSNYTNAYRKIPNCKITSDCFNKKYLVEYSAKNPQRSRILLDKPVEDTLVFNH